MAAQLAVLAALAVVAVRADASVAFGAVFSVGQAASWAVAACSAARPAMAVPMVAASGEAASQVAHSSGCKRA